MTELPNQASSKFPVGAVVGGVIGGIAVTILAGCLLFFLFLRKGPVKYPQFGRTYEGEFPMDFCVGSPERH